MQQTDKATSRPSLALYVSDLAASRAFYTDMLGFERTATPLPDATIAEIIGFDHDPILLVSPDAGDVTGYMQEAHFFIKPGATLAFFCQDLDAQQAARITPCPLPF